jgi:hypothetical protein
MPTPASDQDALLDLWRRLLPITYTEPIESENNGQGFDVPAAQAAILAAASNAVNVTFQAQFLLPYPPPVQTAPPASGAAYAIGEVEITRTASTVGELRLQPGTRLQAQQLGTLGQRIVQPFFVLSSEVVLPEGSRGPIVAPVRAAYVGTTGNLPAGSIVGFDTLGRAQVVCLVTSTTTLQRVLPAPLFPNADRFSATMLGRFVTILGLPSGVTYPRRIVAVTGTEEITIDPPLLLGDVTAIVTVEVAEFADIGLVVSQAAPTTGGLFGELDAIAADRATGRQAGETDDQLRNRINALSDVVSPAAILRICALTLGPCGIRYRLLETRDVATLKGVVWDWDPFDFGSLEIVPIFPGSQLIGQGAVMLGLNEAFTFFAIAVSNGNEGEFGFAYDQPVGARDPAAAWDWNIAWDGRPVGYLSCLGQLYDAIDRARAAGVNWLLFRDYTM